MQKGHCKYTYVHARHAWLRMVQINDRSIFTASVRTCKHTTVVYLLYVRVFPTPVSSVTDLHTSNDIFKLMGELPHVKYVGCTSMHARQHHSNSAAAASTIISDKIQGQTAQRSQCFTFHSADSGSYPLMLRTIP